MPGIVKALLASFVAVVGAAPAIENGGTLLMVAGVAAVVGLAALVLVRVAVGAAAETSSGPERPGRAVAATVVLPQSDPGAPGRARPRAPGAAVAAA